MTRAALRKYKREKMRQYRAHRHHLNNSHSYARFRGKRWLQIVEKYLEASSGVQKG